MDLFLDVEGRRLHHQLRPVPLVLAAPHQLGIQIPVAALLFLLEPGRNPRVGHGNGVLLVFVHHRLVFGGGDV